MPDARQHPLRSALDLIGSTPIVELRRFDTGHCRLFVKLESQNPGGSIKDRIGLSMIEAAERDGLLNPGGTIVEATAGNTGLGLAQVGILKGYKILLIVPDKMAPATCPKAKFAVASAQVAEKRKIFLRSVDIIIPPVLLATPVD